MRPFVARIVVFGMLILGLSGLTVLAQSGSDSPKQGGLLRPVLLEKADLAGKMQQVEEGVLVKLSPRQFQTLQTATKPGNDRLRSKVIAASYRARYTAESNGEANLSGTAEWLVRRPAAGSAVIPLEGLQAAVRQAKWSDGLDAILFKRSHDAPVRLYVPEGDERALNLEWSTRGINEPGEIRFDLGVPSFPIATLELELPADLTPVLPQAEAILTGPFPAAAAEHSWRIAFGGISRLEILLRRTSEATSPLFTRLISSQSLNGTEAIGRYEFQVESAKTGFSELHFAHDSSFSPTSVTANNLVSWAPMTGDPGKPEIIVRLREPTRSAVVVINGTASVNWSPNEWRSPSIRLVNGILRSEKIALAIGPNLDLRDAILRDFTLVKSERRADRSYLLEMEPALKGVSQHHKRPSLVVSLRGQGAWTARQQSLWRVGRNVENLEVITDVASAASMPRVIRFGIPLDWTIERVTSDNREASWSVSGAGKSLLEVELSTSPKKSEVVAYLRRSRHEASQETLNVPDLFPEGCSSRSGLIKIQVDPAIDAVLSDPIPNLPHATSEGMTRQLASIPLSGQLFLSRAPVRHRLAIENNVLLVPRGCVITSALSVTIESGSVSEISYWTPSRIEGYWDWHDETGRWLARADRSPIDDAVASLQALSFQPALPTVATCGTLSISGGYRWRLQFPRPLTRSTKLLSMYASTAEDAHLPLPVLWPVGVPFSGIVHSPSELTGLKREPRWVAADTTDSAEFKYRYGNESLLPQGPAAEIRAPEVRSARIVQLIDAQGECRVSFSLHVRRWTLGNLPLILPEGVNEAEVLVAGRPIQPDPVAQSSRLLEISIPRSNLWTSVELRYRLALRHGFFSVQVPRLTPEGPFDPDSVRGFWQVSPEWRPLVPDSWQVIPGTGERTQKLPAPDWRSFVDRSRLITSNWNSDRVVVDTIAISRADSSLLEATDSKLASLGPKRIVALEHRAGVLITTRKTLDQWRFEAGWLELLPKEVDQAVFEALQLGSDATGRFVNMQHWDSKSVHREDPFDLPAGCFLFEDAGATTDSARLLHRDRVAAGTWFFSMLFAGAILIFVRRSLRNPLNVFCLLATCVVWFVFPVCRYEVAGPALFVFALGTLLNLIPTSQLTNEVIRASNISPRGGATVVSLVLLATIGNGADLVSNQVFEILDPDGRTTSYLVPASLLERNREANGQTPHGPVIVAANYSGSRVGTTADIRATYRLHNFEDGVGRIALPISGARFRSVTLDGAEARDVDASTEGLRVAIAGKGAHVLEVQFTIGLGSSGSERELKFSVPEVPMSRLSFELLGSATPLQVGGWRGAVSRSAIRAGQKLEADLGTSSIISLRWTEDIGVKATTRVKQASIWQITPQSGTLSSLIEFRISGGGVSTFQLSIPGNSDVSRVLVRADATSPTASSARIRDWSLGPVDGNGERKLTIQTLTPIANRVIFSLELTLSTSTRENLSLLFPRPVGVVDVESFAAIVLVGVEEQVPTTLSGLSVSPVEAFVRDVWSTLDGSPYSGNVTAAFRVDGKSPPRINFVLKNKVFRTLHESLTWWIEPTRLIVKAETRVKGSAMSSLEWTLPTDMTVMDISGKGVESWKQGAGKIRVWLEAPVNELSLDWLAIRARSSKEQSQVTIPAIVHAPASEMSIQTRVHAANGWSLSPVEENLPGKTLPPQSAGDLAWSLDRPLSVSLHAHPPEVEVIPQIRTTVKPIDDRIQSVSLVNLDALSRSRPHVVNIQIHNCAGCTVELASPTSWKVTESRSQSSTRHWEIAIPTENAGPRSLKILVSSPGQLRNSWNLPRLTVDIAAGIRKLPNHVFFVDSAVLSLQQVVGLTRISPKEWRIVDREWKGTVVRGIDLHPHAIIRIDQCKIVVHRLANVWTYRTTCSILANQAGVLRLSAPPGTALLSCEVDGQLLKIENGTAAYEIVPASTQLISASWSSPEPNWQSIRYSIEGSEFSAPEIDWRVRVPLGWTLDLDGQGIQERPLTRAARDEAALDPESKLPGSSREFNIAQNSSSVPSLIPQHSVEPIWPLFVAGSLLSSIVLLCSMFPTRSRVLQAAIVALLAAFLLGPSAGIFLIVPLVVAATVSRKLLSGLVHRIRYRDLEGATS